MKKLDPILAEVVRGGLETIADEMGITMTLTATTPIFSEAHDFSTAIFDDKGRMVALSQALTIHMAAAKFSAMAAIEYFGLGGLQEGDMIVLNDPYYGGSHLPDWTVMAPVFCNGRLTFITTTRAHLLDTGGMTPGGYAPEATDIWQEGLRLSPIKLYEGGRPREDILQLLRINNRCPTFMGDLRAMIGSNKVGERHLLELLHKYGREVVLGCVDYILDYAEKRFRAEIREWPDGTYQGVAYLDHDCKGTEDIKVQVTVAIQGDSLTLDYTGSDSQVPGFVNSSVGNTYAWIFLTLGAVIDESIPKNEGLFRPVNVILPLGTVVNAQEPAPCGANTVHIGEEIGEALGIALSQAIPHKAYCNSLKMGFPFLVYGIHPKTGRLFQDMDINISGWCSATYGYDGWGALPPVASRLTLTPVEYSEQRYPLRMIQREYTPDTGGAGQWRGCPGVLMKREVLAPLKANAFLVGRRHPSQGLCGGKPGAPNLYLVRYGSEREIGVQGYYSQVDHNPGEVLYAQYGGGGGWGEPLKREPEKVKEDVIDGYITLQGAREDYGVVIDPATLDIDYQATEGLRNRWGRSTKE